MPIVQCPQCDCDFDLPTVVNGGELFCPSCGMEVTSVLPDTVTLVRDRTDDTVPEPTETVAPTARSGDTESDFGDYQLLDEIARGGMGVVYRARQCSLNRIVAIKMIKSGDIAGEDEIQRFRTEAEAVAQLSHPNIVPIYDYGERNGQHYFAMGFVEGESLHARLAGGSLPIREAAELMKTLSEAVQFAHSRGFIHRDLKPANILLEGGTLPRITDFGLAKRIETDSSLTTTGQIVGTPSYMPPEQAAGRIAEIGPRSDIYSLGAVLYCLVTGRPPFVAAGVLETLKQVAEQDPVPPGQLNATVDRDLETICLRCLEKNPAKRFPTAESLAQDLGRYLQGEPIHARRISRREKLVKWIRRKPLLAGIWGTGILAAISILATLLFAYQSVSSALSDRTDALGEAQEQRSVAVSERIAADRKREEATRAERKAVEALEKSDVSLMFSRLRRARQEWLDGNVADAEAILLRCPPDLRNWEWHYLYGLCHAEERLLRTGDVGATNAVFSPDGKTVAAVSHDSYLRIWNVETGRREKMLQDAAVGVTSAAFTPDGRQVVTLSVDKTLRFWDLKTGKVIRRIADVSTGGGRKRLSFSPSGKLLLTPKGGIIDAATGNRVVADRPQSIQDALFLPDESGFVTVDLQYLQFWNLSGVALRKITVPPVRSLAISADGKKIAMGLFDGVTIIDAESGANILTLRSQFDRFYDLAFTRDGKRLIGAGGDTTIRIWDAISGELMKTFRGHPEPVQTIALNRDESRIVSTSKRSVRIWQTASDAEWRYIKTKGRSISVGTGHRVVASGKSVADLAVFDLKTGRPVLKRPHPGDVLAAQFSRDGRFIATGSSDSNARIWKGETGEPVRTLTGHQGPVDHVAFSRDGRQLATACTADRSIRVWDLERGIEVAKLPNLKRGLVRLESVASSGEWAFLFGGRIIIWNANRSGSKKLRSLPPQGIYDFHVGREGKTLIAAHLLSPSLSVWEVSSGTRRRSIPTNRIMARVAFHPSATRAASVANGNKGAMAVWDVSRGEAVLAFNNQIKLGMGISVMTLYTALEFDPTGRFLVAKAPSGLLVWDADPQRRAFVFGGHELHVQSVAFPTQPDRIVSGSADGTIRVWETHRGRELLTIPAHVSVWDLALHENVAVTAGGGDKAVRVWDLETGREKSSLSAEEVSVERIALDPGGTWLFAGCRDGRPRVYDMSDFRLRHTLPRHSDVMRSVAVSPDGKLAASSAGGKDHNGEFKVWETESWTCLKTIRAHRHLVAACRFLTNGTELATASWDGTIRIWDARSGRQTWSVQTRYRMADVTVSPDGRRIAAADRNKTVHVWDRATKRKLATFAAGEHVFQVRFNRDGSRLAAGYERGTIRLWTTTDWGAKSGK